MTRVVKYDGAPGAGKTTALFEAVDDLAEEGYALDDVLYLTFTRSGRREVRERLLDVYPASTRDERKGSARTFHGAALSECLAAGVVDDVGAQVITQDNDEDVYRAFARRAGLRYETPSGKGGLEGTREGGGVGEASGNRLFAVAEWLTLRRHPPAEHRHAPVSLPFDEETATTLLSAWEEFKRSGRARDGVSRLFEHHDYVAEAVEYGLVPDARTLFVDEFQDLSPLEYELFETWRDAGTFDVIYIAGDANQAIYGFRGATSEFFETTPVDKTRPLKRSYRVPASPARVARGVLDANPDTDHGGFRAVRDGGSARHYSGLSKDGLVELVARSLGENSVEDGVSTFLLARTNRHVSALKSTLRDGGVPHIEIGAASQVWDDGLTAVYRALAALGDERPAFVADVKELLDVVGDDGTGERARRLVGGKPMLDRIDGDDAEAFAYEDVRRAFPEDAPALVGEFEAFRDYQHAALLNALDAGARHPPEHVRVGTIHSAKGLEAPGCILLGDYSKRVEDAYYNSRSTRAEEHRLYYVGASRASETLYVVTDHFDGPTFPGFTPRPPVSELPDDVEDAEEVRA